MCKDKTKYEDGQRKAQKNILFLIFEVHENGNPSNEEETWLEYYGDKEMTVIA